MLLDSRSVQRRIVKWKAGGGLPIRAALPRFDERESLRPRYCGRPRSRPDATGPRRQNAPPDAAADENQSQPETVGFPKAVHNPSQLGSDACPKRRRSSDAPMQSEAKRRISDWFRVGSGLPMILPGFVRSAGSTESLRTIPVGTFGRAAGFGKDCPRRSQVSSVPTSQNADSPPPL